MTERISDERARELGATCEDIQRTCNPHAFIERRLLGATGTIQLLLLDRADLKAENARLAWKLEAVRKVAEGDSNAWTADGVAAYVLAALDSEPPQSPSLDQK